MNDDGFNRREFLILSGKATLLSAILGGGGYLLSRNEYSPAIAPLFAADGNRAAIPDSSFPVLAAIKGTDHAKAAIESVAALGGMQRFISNGDIVAIKPNIGWDRTSEQGANTNPLLVKKAVEMCLEAGAKKVIVTDMPCNDPRRTFSRSGIQGMAEAAGADIILPEERHFVETDLCGEILGAWPVLRQFLECDKLINMPVVKHHGLCKATLGMKNWFGVLGGPRNRLHQMIDISIADLAQFFRPTLVIADATRVMVRNGPVGGRLSDVEVRDTVVAATDQVAADSYSCRYLGLQPEDLRYIAMAESRGLGKAADFTMVERDIA